MNQKKIISHSDEKEVFWKTLSQLEENEEIRSLQKFVQHKKSNRFEHCHNVAVYSFYLALKFNWDVDYRSLAIGGLLHDYFTYDYKETNTSFMRHAVEHPFAAVENAGRIVDLSEKEKNIIISHMWPFPFSPMPRSKEAVLIGMADKYCACKEAAGETNIEEVLERKEIFTFWKYYMKHLQTNAL